MSRVPPELIGLDNVMEDFMADYKRKATRIVPAEAINYGFGFVEPKNLWADAHMRFHFPESESEADRKFIESVEKIRAANKALPKKRLSWAGFLALLAVALVVGWMVYQAVEAF